MNLLKDYEIIIKIQATERQIIYRVIRKSDRQKAIAKVLIADYPTPTEIAYLKHEYEITKNLNLPSIVNVYDLVEYNHGLALILEDFGGESLDRFLIQRQLDLPTFLVIAIQLSKILAEVHQKQIIHQDLKPTNIIINSQTLEVKITDFGIAIDLTRESPDNDIFAGTLAYMSPEQTGRLNLAVDYRTDFYSLGITLYQVLTGQLPFEAMDSLELIHCHIAVNPLSPHQLKPEIPLAISQIVMKLLAKNPEDRYQSARGIKADLESCQTQLLESGTITPFKLGKLDLYSQLTIPKKLYGRSSEIEVLSSFWERVCDGNTEIVLVSGNSGTGKTALISELRTLVTQQQGYFIIGKFEQLQRNIPYSAFINAFNSLIEQILTESLERVKYWQDKLLSCLDNNGKLITDIIPSLQLIIGSRPNVIKLNAKESKNRFNRVFSEFITVFAQFEHPLVLFLDDLQWADLASLQLIEWLIKNIVGHLFILGAYRDNEVSSTHPLMATISKIQANYALEEINLQPLSLSQVNQLITDTLNCQSANSLPLGELIFQRTGGNPFFVNQLLQTLYREKLVNFDLNKLCWQWNLDQIKIAGITNYNMAELVAQKLQKLPAATLKAIKLAACLGNQFDLEFLALASNQSSSTIAQDLSYALQLEIISPVHNQPLKPHKSPNKISYKFSHDRIQQSAYNLIPESEKEQIHLHIGKFLLQKTTAQNIAEYIFDLVYHLNLARQFFSHQSAKNSLANLNLIAAQKAKAAMAYEVAVNHLAVGLKLLPEITWETDYELMLRLHVEAVEVNYLSTNFDNAERLANIVFTRATSLLAKIKVYQIILHSYIAQNQMQLAIETGLGILNLLGIELSQHQAQIDAEVQSLKTELQDKTKEVEALANLPLMNDRLLVAAVEILATMIPAVYIVQPHLFPLISLKTVAIFLEQGNTKLSAFFYASYGLLLCASGEIETGYRFGKLALKLLEKFNAQDISSKVNFAFNAMIRHWKEPGKTSLEQFQISVQNGIEVGDIEHACFNAAYYCAYLFLVGEPLKSVAKKSVIYLDLMHKWQQDFQLNYAQIWQQVNLNLQGLAEDKFLLIGESFDEATMLPQLIATDNSTSLFIFYLAKLILNYLFKRQDIALINASLAEPHIPAALGTMCLATFNFYYSLALLAAYPTASLESQTKYLAQVNSQQQALKQWATHSRANYLHKYQLVEAELARVMGKNNIASDYYDLAIANATEFGYLSEAAIAEELTAEFYWLRGKQRIAQAYLIDAYADYTRWGAVTKVQDLELRYPQLLNSVVHKPSAISYLEPTTKSIGDSSLAKLDLLSIIKASQTISSEIILDNLLVKLMNIVMENAGAERGILFLKEDDSLLLVAEINAKEQKPVALNSMKVSAHLELPISVINYIQSTQKIVILDLANQEGIFTGDRYIVEHQIKSVLGLPIVYQDKLQGIIYLEHRELQGAFTHKQLEILKVLISQISISIENARLYKNLEDHVSVKKSLQQKEVLLKEIHHRVKNNLLVVANLLEFQADYISDPAVLKMLENSQNRINSMALVHEHLYKTVDLDKINFSQYIYALIEKLSYSHATEEKGINFNLDIDEEIELNIETANPCGLIINELISNAIEHAFGDRHNGNITVSLKNNADRITLVIQDDGVGLAEDFDLDNSDSLGLQLISTLVQQLNGTIEFNRTNGTEVKITFSELYYAKRI